MVIKIQSLLLSQHVKSSEVAPPVLTTKEKFTEWKISHLSWIHQKLRSQGKPPPRERGQKRQRVTARPHLRQKQCGRNWWGLGNGGVGVGVTGGHAGEVPGATVSGGPHAVTLNL